MTQTSSRIGSSTRQAKEPSTETLKIAIVLPQLRYLEVSCLSITLTRISLMLTQGNPMTSVNSTTTEPSAKPPSPPPSGAHSKPDVNHVMADLFGSIEEQTPIFNPATGR